MLILFRSVFFIVRCITNERNAFYWRICYDRIHSIYPDAKIYVVDDKSRLQRYTMPSRYTTSLALQPYSYYTKEQLLDYGKLYPDLQIYQKTKPCKTSKHLAKLYKKLLIIHGRFPTTLAKR